MKSEEWIKQEVGYLKRMIEYFKREQNSTWETSDGEIYSRIVLKFEAQLDVVEDILRDVPQ